jgi:hypothetical protein
MYTTHTKLYRPSEYNTLLPLLPHAPYASLVASTEGRTSSDALGVPVRGIRGGRVVGRADDGGGGRVSVSDEGCGLCVFSFCSAVASVEGRGRVVSSISYVGSVESGDDCCSCASGAG